MVGNDCGRLACRVSDEMVNFHCRILSLKFVYVFIHEKANR